MGILESGNRRRESWMSRESNHMSSVKTDSYAGAGNLATLNRSLHTPITSDVERSSTAGGSHSNRRSSTDDLTSHRAGMNHRASIRGTTAPEGSKTSARGDSAGEMSRCLTSTLPQLTHSGSWKGGVGDLLPPPPGSAGGRGDSYADIGPFEEPLPARFSAFGDSGIGDDFGTADDTWTAVQLQKRVKQLEGELIAASTGTTGGPSGGRFVGGAQFRQRTPSGPMECAGCVRLNNQAKRLKKDRAAAHAELQGVMSQNQSLEARFNALNTERERVSAHAQQLEKKLLELSKALEEARGQAETAGDRERARALREGEGEAEKQILRGKMKEIESGREVLKKQAMEARKQCQEHMQAREAANKELTQMKKDFSELLAQREKMLQGHKQETSSLRANLEKTTNEAVKCQSQMQASQQQIHHLEGKLRETQECLTDTQRALKKIQDGDADTRAGHQEETSRLQQELEEKKEQLSRLQGVNKELERVSEDMRARIAALDEELFCAVARADKMYLECENANKDRIAENIRLQKENAEFHEKFAEQAEAHDLEMKKLKEEMSKLEESHVQALKELKDELDCAEIIKALRAELAEEKAASRSAAERIAVAEAKAEQLREQVEELERQLEDMRSQVSRWEAVSQKQRNELMSLRRQLDKARGEVGVVAKERDGLQSERAEILDKHQKELSASSAAASAELDEYKQSVRDELEGLRAREKGLRDAHVAAQIAVDTSEDRLQKSERALETATVLAQRNVSSVLQGKLSVSVLAPSVRVSFGGGGKDLVVIPNAPKDKIESVLKTRVLPGFCQAFLAEKSDQGPNGEEVNAWLAGVMDGMVATIDEHVSSVLKNVSSKDTKVNLEKQKLPHRNSKVISP